MRSIKTTVLLLSIPLLAGLMLAGVLNVAHMAKEPSRVSPVKAADEGQTVAKADLDAPQAPAIRPSLLISIPYGFAPTFPLRANGNEVIVQGHGSCTDGETFTVAVTVTHDTTGDIARGNLTETCVGEATRQEWQLTATAKSDPLTVGPAETCGLVQTDDGNTVTDEQMWCVDVNLGDYLYLPIVIKEE